MVIQAIQSQAITPAEQAIGGLARCKLCFLSTWEQWRAGEHIAQCSNAIKLLCETNIARVLTTPWMVETFASCSIEASCTAACRRGDISTCPPRPSREHR